MNASKKRLVLLDGHALLFRAYHAMPGFTTPDGRPSGAVYGFTNVLLRVLRELEPTWIICCFDAPGPTFRDAIYPDYKATRAETPADLILQEPMVEEVLTALAIPYFARVGFEADDLLATLVHHALTDDTHQVQETVIVTGDRDLLQLSRSQVLIYLLRKSIKDIELLDEAAVTTLMGLPPSRILDWKALRGDPSDNIVGVPGIGDKTALRLIERFQSLEKVYEAVRAGKVADLPERLQTSLITYTERAFQNRELLTVRTDAPVTLDLAAATRANYSAAAAKELLTRFGFRTILTRLPSSSTGEQTRLF